MKTKPTIKPERKQKVVVVAHDFDTIKKGNSYSVLDLNRTHYLIEDELEDKVWYSKSHFE